MLKKYKIDYLYANVFPQVQTMSVWAWSLKGAIKKVEKRLKRLSRRRFNIIGGR